MENQYFTTWKIIKFFKWFLKNKKLNSKIKSSINWSFVILIFAILKFRNIGRDKSKKFRCKSKFSEFWVFGVLTFRNLALVSFGCRLTDHSDFGWRSKFGTTKCRTADISKIRNFEYWNNASRNIRFFYFQIYFLNLRLLELFEHSKNMIIYQIGNFWNFDSFTNCKIFKIC